MIGPNHYIARLQRRLQFQKGIEVILWGVAAGALVFGVTSFINFENALIAGITGVVVVSAALWFGLGYHNLSLSSIVNYLNQKYPFFNESADLLLKSENEITRIEKLQRSKVEAVIQEEFTSLRLRHKIKEAALLCIASVAVVTVLMSVDLRPVSKEATLGRISEPQASISKPLPTEIDQITISVSPPKYTRVPAFVVKTAEMKLPEGSTATWTLTFTEKANDVQIIFSKNDSLTLTTKDARTFSGKRILKNSTLYQISWTGADGKKMSDYYRIETVTDKAPEVAFIDQRQSVELTLSDHPVISLKAKIADDYQIADAYIIATVAKGSGESVKFREEKIRFTSPTAFNLRNATATKSIDIKGLGLEPGDELYFYAEAIDNKPIPNRSRTETYFITLLDTASQEMSVDAGLGVDLMPEYFRSQRQIIIDTEKLIRNKKTLSKHEFNFLSNELGYDQKVLRLKYGEFLGEEFESELTSSDEIEEQVEEQVMTEESEEGDDEDMASKFGHAHDKDNEHNLVEEKKHGHQHEEKDPEEKEDPLEEFVHAHDDTEEATFFLQSVRTKLKAALTEMWDAELYLRLYQPEKSLPYQYKALKLLKEVSNDSRIYVHKTGFDPPPIKEEKRLTGDLSEVKTSNRQELLTESTVFPAVRNALTVLENMNGRLLSEDDSTALVAASNEIAAMALERPSLLTVLSSLRAILSGEIDDKDRMPLINSIKNQLYRLLPVEAKNLPPGTASSAELDKRFLDQLRTLKND